jgi:hypothetical protein
MYAIKVEILNLNVYQFHILDQLLAPNVALYLRLDHEMKKCIQKVLMGMLAARQSKRTH